MFEAFVTAFFGPIMFLFPDLKASMLEAYRHAFDGGYATTAIVVCLLVSGVCIALAVVLGVYESRKG